VRASPTLRDAAAVLAAAFADGVLFGHVEPDRERRLAGLRWLFEGTLLHCSRHGSVEVVGEPDTVGAAPDAEVRAVAGWVPGERLSLTAADLVRTGLVATPARLGPRATRRLERHERPSEARLRDALTATTAYLWVVGADPDVQGRGLGRAALEAALTAMARTGHDRGLLRTDDEANVAWYERQGFELIERLDDLPSGLPAWILARPVSTG
jgi:ribosomal protein S18 acetylase RimI-like enzyme